jgi:diguanylate cyclase (GGDEF)-like protein/PAS domain S-box-containing protein
MKSPGNSASVAPMRHSWLAAVGLNTILGRFLLMAAILVITTLFIAVVSEYQVKRASRVSTSNLTDRVAISQTLRELSNLLWQTETLFQSYMLVPNAGVRETVFKQVDHISTTLQGLEQQIAVDESSDALALVQQLRRDTEKLRALLATITTMRADPLQVFPNMRITVEELYPLSNEFNSTVPNVLNESGELSQGPHQHNTINLFQQARYLWSQKVNTFRLLISTRLGIHSGSMETSLQINVADIKALDQHLDETLARLKQLDNQGQLAFEQSIAVNDLYRIQKEWNKSYKEVKAIILSDDGWRLDTPILRDKISPLFVEMWQSLQRITLEVEQRAANDVGHITQVADQVTYYLWLLTAAVLLIVFFGTLIFEFQIRRPILRVIRALKAEALGEENLALPHSPIVETHDLIAAFANMREQIHSRQEHLQAILTYSAEAIVTMNEQGTIESFNPASVNLFGYTAAEAVGQNINILIPSPTKELHDGYLQHYQRGNPSNVIGKLREVMGQHKDGTLVSIILHVTEMFVGGQRLFLGMLSDNRERRAMLDGIQAREQRLRSILDNTAEGIVTFDENGLIEHWNRAAEQLFGWGVADVIGTSFLQFVSNQADTTGNAAAQHLTLAQYLARETEVVGNHQNGSRFPLSLKVSRMILEGKTKYTALIANISERKAMMENLRRLAEHDSLTGLYNRAYFHAELERAFEKVKRFEHSPFAVLYIDLDNFKYINDTLGHAAGDKLLIEVAQLLNNRTRRSDLVARLGGDEFVVLLSESNANVIQPIAESFRRHLADYAFHYDGRTVDIGCSIGVALINSKTQSSGEVMSQADIACHLAKRAGRNRIHVFTTQDDGDVHTMSIDMGWSRRIKQALEHDHFVLALQPIVATKTRKCNLFEVLIRMREADGSIIMPSGFLPTAERFGLAAEIDAWVIRHAIAHLAHARQHGADIHYSINLSGQSITTAMLTELIPTVLAQTKIAPAALIFEITETAAIADMNMAVTLLSQLRALGCRTALDDFGSGMSSFAYLRELPVDIVKIDGRFVKNIANSAVDQAMVKAMNDIAHALGKETIAEFVENENHYQVLCELGVDYGQGYHLGKPALIELHTAATPPLQKGNPAASA